MLARKKLYSAIVLAGLLVLGFVATSVIGYLTARQSMMQHISSETLPLTSDNVYSEIEHDLLRSVLISSLMAHDTLLRDWTLAGETDPQQIARYLGEIQHKYGTTTVFYVSDRSRNYYHSSGTLKQVNPDDPQDAWYFRTRDLSRDYEINIDTDTADKSRVTIFVNYKVADYQGNFIGVAGIGLSVNTVAGLIENYQSRFGREIFLTDRQGNVTLRGNRFEGPSNIRDRPGMGEVADRILSAPSTTVSYPGSHGGSVYVNSRLIPEFDWYLIVQQVPTRSDKRVLDALLINIAIALAIAALVGLIGWFSIRNYQFGLEQMASTDTLTGCTTRRAFDAVAAQVLKNARRSRLPTSLLVVDVDRFKQINDEHGHAAGDCVLRSLVGVLRNQLRESDIICRWGGDEFVILLANCNQANAHDLANRMRERVAARSVAHGDKQISMAVSIGIAEHEPGEELHTLVSRADAAMYKAKNAGRDRVEDA